MALRRLAQENRASNTSSPRSPNTSTSNSPFDSVPITPRNRLSYGIYRSPASTPSVSSSTPFDWEAAKSRKPPPYATPLQNKGRKSVGNSNGIRKAVVRKMGFFEKLSSIPSTIAFEIALFPHNVPLPSPKMSARLVGGAMHLFHLIICINRRQKTTEYEVDWEDMSREQEGEPWFDWTTPITALLIAGAIINTIYLFTRFKTYRLFHRQDPVSSPRANFVPAQLDSQPLEQISVVSRIGSALMYTFSYSWRFLLGMKPPSRTSNIPGKTQQVQQLEVWTPGDFELEFFSVFSPAHTLLWLAMNSLNWILVGFIMGLVGVQTSFLIHSYNGVIKDKEIISAEVMHEYNKKYVYPRTNPVRRDAAVMTHESELVNVWED